MDRNRCPPFWEIQAALKSRPLRRKPAKSEAVVESTFDEHCSVHTENPSNLSPEPVENVIFLRCNVFWLTRNSLFCKDNFDETSEEDDKFDFERLPIMKIKIFQTAAFIRQPQIRTADRHFPVLPGGPDPRLYANSTVVHSSSSILHSMQHRYFRCSHSVKPTRK